MKRILSATVFAAALALTGVAQADDAPMDWLFGDTLSSFNHGTAMHPYDAYELREETRLGYDFKVREWAAAGGCNAPFLPFYVAWNCGSNGSSWAYIKRNGE